MCKTLILEEKMGGLRQIVKTRDPRINLFSATIKEVSRWQNYGTYVEYRLKITHDGQQDNIMIDGYEFSSVIKDVYFSEKSNPSNNHHYFTINGRASDGDLFEMSFRINGGGVLPYIDGDEVLPYIVYAFILICQIKNKDKVNEIWEAFLGEKYTATPDEFCEITNIRNIIVAKYPFMEMFLQKSLKNINIKK